MGWLTTDRLRCLDCGAESVVRTRWFSEGRTPRCAECQSVAMVRRDNLWRTLRDVLVVTNGA